MEISKASDLKGTILIVDDTPHNLRLLSNMLAQQGYEVRCAISGDIALMAVETEHPDVILLDINMPGMDGYAVCRHLKTNAHTREIPVIFLSALGEAIDKVKAFEVGGIDYITKPFQLEEVLARIDNQLALRQLQVKLQKAEAEALRALAQEKELNRLKAEFVSLISHDFRTPLTTIRAFAELLEYESQTISPETIHRYTGKIGTAVDHLLYLLDEVLLIGSLEAGKVKCQPISLDLEKFCRELVETLQVSAARHHQIDLTCIGCCTEVQVDPTLLQQILTNLLSNSIKYSLPEGKINLEVGCQGKTTTFRVRDQGIGIPVENQANLFETFYRCNNAGEIQGTGLGLAVVKRCVDAHQGEIHLESREGAGTTITVTLPAEVNGRDRAASSNAATD